MLQLPSMLLSIALVSIIAIVFFLLKGRSFRDLLFFWLAALVGFATGHLVGTLWGFIPWTLGAVHVIEAAIVALLFLILTRWLRQGRKSS